MLLAKTCINFSYLKETLKDLEAINPKEFHPKKHISHLTKKKKKKTKKLLLIIYLIIVSYFISPILFLTS